MSVIAEAVVSVIAEAALSALFDTLCKNISEMFVSEKEVLVEIKKWEGMMFSIRDVLDDAEEKQITNQLVKNWLNDLKDLAYDMEDVLDEFSTESLRRTFEGEPKAATSKIRNLIPSCCTCFSPRALSFNSMMISRIKETATRLQTIATQINGLGLVKIDGGASISSRRQPLTTCLLDEPQVYGRDADKSKILEMLMRDDSTDANVGVLPIVGMGGLGKTTLARLIYDDESVRQKFPTRGWVCVSDEFDIPRIAKSILESITSEPCNLNADQVQVQLKNKLEGRRFLIVLDDVWSQIYDDWHQLRSSFTTGASGSRIIVTTRDEVVARNMGTMMPLNLQPISDDNCWKLFERHAFESFDGRAGDAKINMELIRAKVMSTCVGLPLAARTLGGLLRSKPTNRWETTLNSNLWSLMDDGTGILPVLKISYYHLPSHLKRCFTYCAIFPKDYEFTEAEVVLLWMAEGLIQHSDDGEKIEEVGSDYFHELLSRSLFQAANSDTSKFAMHDLVNDLAKLISGDTCFRLEDEASVSKLNGKRVRHSSYIPSWTDGIKRFKPFLSYEMPHLRTLLPISLKVINSSDNYLTRDVIYSLLPKLRCLRVLSFKGYTIDELPESIGKLKHLRYLDFSFTRIECLPENIVSLCNLQTLLLRGCRCLKKLPSRMEKLINLRHLDIENVSLEEGLPLGLKELVSLRTLSHFPVGQNCGAGLGALKNLNLLQGEVHISGLDNQKRHRLQENGRDANLKEKKGLEVLRLEWGEGHAGDERNDGELLAGLQPTSELKGLNIRGYGGTSFPSWLGLFRKLDVLRLENCKECTSLPSLGLLPSLRELFVEGMPKVISVGSEFYGEGCSNSFPALQTLWFRDMHAWENWNPYDSGFPCLNKLVMKLCPKLLGKLPSHLSTLKKLDIDRCEELVVSLPSLPEILELTINGCKEVDFRNMVEFGSPNSVILERISKSTLSLTNRVIEQFMNSKRLRVDAVIDSLYFNVMPKLSSDVAEDKEKERRVARGLEVLEVRDSEFFHLNWLHRMNLKSLRELKFSNCDALTSVPNVVGLEQLTIKGCKSLISISSGQLSSSLKVLIIEYCNNLEIVELDSSLVNSLDNDESCNSLTSLSLSLKTCNSLTSISLSLSLTSLSLSLKSCESLTSLSLSPTLPVNSLFVWNCDSLTSLSLSPTLPLKLLDVSVCHSLTSLSLPATESELPTTLKKLLIERCKKLDSVAGSFKNNRTLESIYISDCESLRYLPNDLHNLSHLNVIFLNYCPNLVSFPCTTSLKQLKVGNCDNVVNFLLDNLISLHELTTLTIKNFTLCESLSELHRFSALRDLSISSGVGEMVSFPCEDEMGIMLPPSLLRMELEDFPKLKYLTNGFQNLTSLEKLKLQDCPMLTSFPKNGLPRSLLRLEIRFCPLLAERCAKDKGQEWHKIAHIPYMLIYK